MRYVEGVQCPRCKRYVMKILDKNRYYKCLIWGTIAVVLGILSIKAMYQENDMDPVIAFGYLLGSGFILLGAVFIVHSIINQRSSKKAIYKCSFCSFQV